MNSSPSSPSSSSSFSSFSANHPGQPLLHCVSYKLVSRNTVQTVTVRRGRQGMPGAQGTCDPMPLGSLKVRSRARVLTMSHRSAFKAHEAAAPCGSGLRSPEGPHAPGCWLEASVPHQEGLSVGPLTCPRTWLSPSASSGRDRERGGSFNVSHGISFQVPHHHVHTVSPRHCSRGRTVWNVHSRGWDSWAATWEGDRYTN